MTVRLEGLPPNGLLGYDPLVPAPLIEYSAIHLFALDPGSFWESLEDFDRFGRWWSWLQDFRIESAPGAKGLVKGSILYGVVAPPVPYKMRVRVEITDAVRYHSINADVHGDLEGVAHMVTLPERDGTKVQIGWKVEMMQAPMRVASRFAFPLLRFGHDRVVDATIAGFRKHLDATGRRLS
jgi:hypothetical protein